MQAPFQREQKSREYTSVNHAYPSRDAAIGYDNWNQPLDGYKPITFTARMILNNSRTADRDGWADPVTTMEIAGQEETYPVATDAAGVLALYGLEEFQSWTGPVTVDSNGYPCNPDGPTGICGRGLLPRWGANQSVDIVVLREKGAGYEALVIIRDDAPQVYALPGAVVRYNKTALAARKRALSKATPVDLLSHYEHQIVYRGLNRDSRETDNAWIETEALCLVIPEDIEVPIEPTDNARAALWIDVNNLSAANTFASHKTLISKAWAMQKRVVPDISAMKKATKTKPLMAIPAREAQTRGEIGDFIHTLEGWEWVRPDSILCRGIIGEPWQQTIDKLESKYTRGDPVDTHPGYYWYHPKPENEVWALQVTDAAYGFTTEAYWGLEQPNGAYVLFGKQGDYVLRSATDPHDYWVVDEELFNRSYDIQK